MQFKEALKLRESFNGISSHISASVEITDKLLEENYDRYRLNSLQLQAKEIMHFYARIPRRGDILFDKWQNNV